MHGTSGERIGSLAALWASAFVIAALILLQAGRGVGPEARAEMVSSSGAFTILTANGGTDDVCVILDERNEELLVYRAVAQDRIQFESRVSLREIFVNARAQAGG